MADNSEKKGYQGQRHPNEDKIVKFPKIPQVGRWTVDVKEGAESVEMPEEMQDIYMQRQDVPDFDQCHFKTNRTDKRITILETVLGIHKMNYANYQREKFPKGIIPLGELSEVKGLYKILFQAHDDEVTLAPLVDSKSKEDKGEKK